MSSYKFIVPSVDAVRNVKYMFPSSQDVQRYIDKKRDNAWYETIFDYTEEHKKRIQEKGSNAGITDNTTHKLVWDFDSASDVELARSDAKILCSRLLEHGIKEDEIEICFSGKKGFSVVVRSKSRFSAPELRAINTSLAQGLTTNDTSILDSNRILRVMGSRHEKSGLYKTPLQLEELNDLSVEQIKDKAKVVPDKFPEVALIDLPPSIVALKTSKALKVVPKELMDVSDLNFTKKPKGFTNCKYAILNGFFPNGHRNSALQAIAATAKGTGFAEAHALALCIAARDAQESMYGDGSNLFKDNEIENLVGQVYKPTWNGGMYSCKSTPWLKEICDSLGIHKCKDRNDEVIISSKEVFTMFSSYAESHEKNLLSTGIKSLDEKVSFLVGTSNGILAPPGVGKTSLSLSMLNHNSLNNVHSIFFSYDMFHSMVFMRLLQKHTGLQQAKIYDVFKHDKKQAAEWNEMIYKEYDKVNFCFKSGQSPDEIEQTIVETEEKIGNKIKLIVVDYNELVVASSNDPTQASAEVAQRLRQIANDREVCAVTLLQPSKHYSNPADEAASYQAAKGSGAIAQSMTLMLGLSRPGFNTTGFAEDDRFFSIVSLKNRNGPPFTLDLGWEGLKGQFYDLDMEDKERLEQIRNIRDTKKAEANPY